MSTLYSVGDKVVYPHHGAAVVERRETKEAFGKKQEYLVLRLAYGDLTLMVPADNTDGVGMMHDITINLGIPIAGKRVLLLGAGGAARGVVGPLLDARPASLVIANRTEAKTHVLAKHFKALGTVSGSDLPDLAGQQFDIVINATSASLDGTMPDLPEGIFAPGSLAYKMMYGQRDTPFEIFARNQGVGTFSDGLGMLVEQAAEAFYLWRGVRPEGLPVLAMLRGA